MLLFFKIVEQRQLKQQLKLLGGIFILLANQAKQQLFVLKIHFMEELAAINASGSKKMTLGFGPKVPGFQHFEFGDHKKLKSLINKNTAAIMIETIMGEGGIKVIPTGV